jgi:hypothetical protein
VAVSGSTVVVGTPTKNSSAGKAYVFAKSGSKWPQQAELTALDAAANDQFGFAVAISGPTVLVGAPAIPSASIGAAYVFVKSGSSWSQQAKLTAPDAVSGDQYGLSVALSGSTGLVGAPNGSSSGAGAAYVLQGV